MGSPLFLRASAGSGKTYRLVLEYLRLLLQQPHQYKSILAVTFTNDATAEMKARILKELDKIIKSEPGNMSPYLEEIGSPALLAEKAAIAFGLILHDYSHFAVMTIDSFFQMVLRSFARELQLPIGYSVELDNDAALQFAMHALLSKIGTEKQLTDWLCDFARSNLNEGKTWNIEKQVSEISAELFKEISRHREWEKEDLAQEKLTDLHKALIKIKINFENRMQLLAEKARELIDAHHIERGDVFGGYLLSYLEKIDSGNYIPNETLKKAFSGETTFWKATATEDVKNKVQQCLDDGFQAIVDQLWDMISNHFIAYNSADLAIKHIYNLGILSWVRKYIIDYRNEENALMISDTLLILESLICGENTPFIYEKIGVRFKHVLMDEFQDTSRMQWKNMLPLLLHQLSQGGNVLIVGDAKQSIYRWRGGDMNLLLQQAPEDLEIFEPVYDSLDTNYRSQDNIISFNNHFFRWLVTHIDHFSGGTLAPVYEGFEQALPKDKDVGKGYVEIRFITNQNDEEDTLQTLALMQLPDLITEVCSRGYELGDIGLLIRDKNLSQQVANRLMLAGIPVVTPQSLLLCNDQRIQLLEAALRLCADSSVGLYRVNFAQKYAIVHDLNLSDEAIFRLALPESARKIQDYFEQVPYLRQLPLGELNEWLVLHLLGDTATDAFLLEWQDRIQQFISEGSARTEDFLEWWEEQAENITVQIPQSKEAVRLMTIHKCKGLEFKIVIMPFVNWQIPPKSTQLLWVKEDETPYNSVPYIPVNCVKGLQESYFSEDYENELAASLVDNINLLYVACTRAVQELYLFCPDQELTKKKTEDFPSRVGLFFTAAFTEGQKLPVGRFEENTYTLGEKTSPDKQTVPDKSTICPTYLSSPLDTKVSLRSFRKEEATQGGKAWHALLAELVNADNVAIVVKAFLSHTPVDGETDETLTDKIEAILSLEESLLPSGFNSVLAERSLLWNGEFLRPDKVTLRGSEAIIIDYKTGERSPKHLQQMQQYRAALEGCGYMVLRAELIYTDTLTHLSV